MLQNLKAEMARYSITSADIAKKISRSERNVRDKLNGEFQFTIEEAKIIKDELFPGMSLEYLFAKSNGKETL